MREAVKFADLLPAYCLRFGTVDIIPGTASQEPRAQVRTRTMHASTPHKTPDAAKVLGSCFYGGGPLGPYQHVRWNDLTVLLGPNGSGKSSFIRALAYNLPDLVRDPVTLAGIESYEAWEATVFYAEVSRVHLRRLLAEGLRARNGQPSDYPDDDWVPGAFPAGLSMPSGSSRPGRAPLRAWRTLLEGAESRLSAADTRHLITYLERSSTIAVHPRPGDGQVLAYWCVSRHQIDADPRLRALIERSGLDGGPAQSEPSLYFPPGGPVICAPIGKVNARGIIPVAAQAPLGPGPVIDMLRFAFALYINVARQAVEPDAHWTSPFETLEQEAHWDVKQRQAAMVADSVWREARGGGWTRESPAVDAIVAAASKLFQEALPPFVSSRLSLGFTREAGEPGAAGVSISGGSYPAVADGYRLWIELAAVETSRLILSSARGMAEASKARRAKAPTPTRASVTRITGQRQDPCVYLIDEPERHLHPALARQAATWLQHLSLRPATQVVIATHSPTFLRLQGAVSWNYLEPEGIQAGPYQRPSRPRTAVRSFLPHDVDAFGALADTMGYDRGELMVDVRLILFVEGEADREVLDGLFGRELHAAGVAVVPIHGATRAEQKGVVDSEVLLRFTSAKVALMLDAVDVKLAAELATNASRRHAIIDKKTRGTATAEAVTMARVIEGALRNERIVTPIGLAVRDIFDLLDERLLKSRFPRFPGHRIARRDCGAHWKRWYAEHYGLDVLKEPTIFGEIARRMKRGGPLSNELASLLDRVLRAASPDR